MTAGASVAVEAATLGELTAATAGDGEADKIGREVATGETVGCVTTRL